MHAAHDSSFDQYLDQLATCDVMSADEERAAALHVAETRTQRWLALLARPEALESILELAKELLPRALDAKRCAAARRAAERVRSSAGPAHVERWERVTAELAEHFARIDRDHVLADAIMADLDAMAGGARGRIRLALRPPIEPGALEQWARRVRSTTQAFWQARGAFARANLRLVVSMARRIGRGRMSMADLVQEGNIGLLQAIDRFDHTKGFRFSTYGAWWIRHAMNRALQNKAREIRLPVHVLDALYRIRRIRRAYEAEHGEQAPLAFVAAAMNMPEHKVARLERHAITAEAPNSLDEPFGGDAELDRLDVLQAEEPRSFEDEATAHVVQRAVERAVESLPVIERKILRLRFGLDDENPLTLREIGEQFSLSRERIRQLQERALERIRGELGRHDLL